MYIVGNILIEGWKHSPNVAALYEVPDYDQAIDLAVEMVREQLSDEDGEPLADRDEIVEEIENDGAFTDPNGQWAVFVQEPARLKNKGRRRRK